jgi:hypothetical protein
VNRRKIVGAFVGVAAVAAGGIAVAAVGVSKPTVRVSLTSSATIVAAGGTWSYNIAYSCASPRDTCRGVVVQLTLPSGVTINTPPEITGGRAAITNTDSFVKVVFTDDLLDGTSGVFTATVQVPSCVAPGNPQPAATPAKSTISADSAASAQSLAPIVAIAKIPDCDVPAAQSCGSSCPPPAVDLSRSHYKSGRDAAPGGKAGWYLAVAPRAAAFDVLDVLPAGMVASEVGSWNVKSDVRCGTEWVALDYYVSRTNLPDVCRVGASASGTSRYPAINAVRMHVDAKVGADLEITAFIADTAVPGSTIKNCATAQTPTAEPFCGSITVLPSSTIPDPRIQLVGSPEVALHDATLFSGNTPAASADVAHPMGRGDLAYLAGVRVDERSGSDLINPVFAVELSPDQTFDTTGAEPNWQIAYAGPTDNADSEPGDPKSQPGCMNPTFKQRLIGGTENLIWSFANCTLPRGLRREAELEVFFTTRLKPGIGAGAQLTAGLSVGEPRKPDTNPFATDLCSGTPTDANDLDGDGLNTDALCGGGTAYYRMPTHAELTASNTVQGSLDKFPTLYPQAGSTDEDGLATFAINLKNTGTVGISSIDLVSILPFAGDNVLGNGEGSAWDMKLRSIAAVQRVAVDGTITTIAPANYTVGYSMSKNPCRFNTASLPALYAAGAPFPANASVTAPAGCTANPWTGSAANAASWGLRYQPPAALSPGEVIRVVVDVVRANKAVAVPNGIAWNSVAFSADTSLGTRLLANQPRVGGVRIVDTAPAVAGMVWDDDNKNGLREDIEHGVENVAVDVLNPAGVVVASTKTDSRGTYFVSDLVAGTTYTVRFRGSAVSGKDATKYHVGTDTTRDNDGRRIGLNLDITDAKTSERYISGGLDLGLIEAPVYGAT